MSAEQRQRHRVGAEHGAGVAASSGISARASSACSACSRRSPDLGAGPDQHQAHEEQHEARHRDDQRPPEDVVHVLARVERQRRPLVQPLAPEEDRVARKQREDAADQADDGGRSAALSGSSTASQSAM